MVREGRVFIAASGTGDPDFASGYSVQALEVGAQVASGSSGTTITVRAGHGFAAGDKYMKSLDVLTYSGTNTVQSVTSTTVVVQAAYSVSAGDLLINLGPDTGTASPNYDGNGVTVYTDMDYTTTATKATVTTGSTGQHLLPSGYLPVGVGSHGDHADCALHGCRGRDRNLWYQRQGLRCGGGWRHG